MGTIKFYLTKQVFHDVLRLPSDVEIAMTTLNDVGEGITLHLTSSVFPEPVMDGDPIPVLTVDYAVADFDMEEDGELVGGTIVTGFGLNMGMTYEDTDKPVILHFDQNTIIPDEDDIPTDDLVSEQPPEKDDDFRWSMMGRD
jgi:hypothetical protein